MKQTPGPLLISSQEAREPGRASMSELAAISGRPHDEIKRELRALRAKRVSHLSPDTTLNVVEVSWLLAIPPRHLRERLRDGRFPAEFRFDEDDRGRWAIRLGDLLAYEPRRPRLVAAEGSSA